MELIESLLSLNPLWVILTILGGIITGIITSDIPMDKRTIGLLLLWYVPFAGIRILIFLLFGPVIASGSGYIGVLLFNFYLIAIILGRKIGKKVRD